jgi:hypothetical protein
MDDEAWNSRTGKVGLSTIPGYFRSRPLTERSRDEWNEISFVSTSLDERLIFKEGLLGHPQPEIIPTKLFI